MTADLRELRWEKKEGSDLRLKMEVENPVLGEEHSLPPCSTYMLTRSRMLNCKQLVTVSYTHLTLPTKLEV